MPEITLDRPSQRVLIVEDAGHVRSMLCDLFGAWGWQADGVLNASEALEHLARCRYDLLLTDFRMLGMTGVELVERVRARHAGLPVIMLTASSDDLDLTCRRLGVTLLRKPLEIARLKSVLPRMQDVPAHTPSVGAALPAGFDAR